jgi:hypothetical protein
MSKGEPDYLGFPGSFRYPDGKPVLNTDGLPVDYEENNKNNERTKGTSSPPEGPTSVR